MWRWSYSCYHEEPRDKKGSAELAAAANHSQPGACCIHIGLDDDHETHMPASDSGNVSSRMGDE